MSKMVLIVEDESALSHALDLKLRAEGFETAIAKDGKTALEIVQTSECDIVLLDIIMPVLDGFHFLEELKAYSPQPKVIVLSNLAQPDDEKKVLELGALKYLVKSDTPLTAIVDEVKKQLG